MALVVADTGPPHYLLLIGQVDLLRALFGQVAMPETVAAELRHPRAPSPVRAWAEAPPPWLTVAPASPANAGERPGEGLAALHPGERAAIGLAEALGAALVLMDDRAGVAAARRRGLVAIGTIGILDLAARRAMLDLGDALAALKETNFRYPPALLDTLIADSRRRGRTV